MRALAPRFREDFAAVAQDVVDHGAVHVRAVDVELGEGERLALDVLCEWRRPFLFRTVGRRDRARHDYRDIEVSRDVLLISVETFRPALSAVPHLGVFNGNAPVLSDTLAYRGGAVSVPLKVLLADRLQGGEERRQGRLHDFVQVPLDPVLKSGHLAFDDLDCRHLLPWIAPVDIESSLDTWCEQQGNSRPATDLLDRSADDLGHNSYDVSCGVAEQVDCVFNAPGSR